MFVSSFVALAVLAGPGADPGSMLAARYRQYNALVERNDGKAMVAWFSRNTAPAFKYRSHDGNVFARAAFLQGVREQSKSISRALSSSLKVARVRLGKDTAALTVNVEFEGMVKFDGTPLKLVEKSTLEDVWRKKNGAWLLESSRQVKTDTQMFNPEG